MGWWLGRFASAEACAGAGRWKKAERVPSSSFAKFRPLITPTKAFRHAEARGECAGRNGCLLYSGHNHWSVLEKVVTLKVFRSSTPCIDSQSS